MLRSLRFRAFMVAVVVAFAPLSVVAIVGALEIRSEPDMQRAADQAATELTERFAAEPEALVQPTALVEQVARRHHVRVRLLDPTGTVMADADATRTVTVLEDLFLGPEDEPALQDADEQEPAVMDRPIPRAAVHAETSGHAAGCETWASGTLRVCQVARVLWRDGEVLALVYVQQAHRRAIRALYDLRFALLKLTLFVAAGALLLGWWLGWRMVRPLHRLRNQALEWATAHARDQQVETVSPGLELAREDEIGDMATAFNRLLEALHERARHNAEFVADLTHEFKNPVAAVRACAESLASHADAPLPPARTERLARVLRDSSARLDALVTQFLELARAEAGMVGEDRGPVDLTSLVRGVVETIAAQPEHATVEITHELQEVIVPGVSGRLETAVRNLVENAASFAGQDGHVRVTLRRQGSHARLEVHDDGPGIAPEDLPRVFDRFFTRRQGRKGTGLGLALVKAIAHAHGGRARVRSTVGEGSTFSLRLPLSARAEAAIGSASIEPTRSRAERHENHRVME
ncbi:sensor histidine kinase [Paraliomyxa miuraensis]|uniref:sensor histidine kinase n=1 Tax=Paraliomyxa miuraensis TaxID=376150 RepID=UPI002257B49F|nr:HAMP domain-containing sensor histidine kinase [Paraliomyxa miuraensis]MCX4247525.1 HAMP domain-containing histidine kinase [Paraliomyxa miuraensis]